MIQLKNVSKFYYSKGIIASGISKVNLELNIGEFVVITGESGGGKTTLLNVISGLDSYEEGEMYIDGKETSHYLASDFEEYRKQYIGNIFQNFNLVNSYTVYQNIELILLINGYAKADIKRRVPEIIGRVGLEAYTRTKVSKLSGGQKQRVSIARALAKDTDIIVADEPTGNLDSVSAEGIVKLLSEISGNKLVIVVTHNYEQFAPYATRRIKMHDGKVVEDEAFEERMDPQKIEVVAAGTLPESVLQGDILPGMKPSAQPVFAKQEESPGYPSNGEESDVQIDAKIDVQASVQNIVPRRTTLAEQSDKQSGVQKIEQSDKQSEKKTSENITKRETINNSMKAGSKLRLGFRNTFNIIPKFILLLIVFLFVVVAVTSEYTSFQNQDEEAGKFGFNEFFYNYSEDRVILKKSDDSQFTRADLRTIRSVENVKSVAVNDILLDSELFIEEGAFSYGAYPRTWDEFDGKLIAGKMPKDDNEVIITGYKDDSNFEPESLDKILNKEYTVSIGEDKEIKVKPVGAAYKGYTDENYIYAGDIYMSRTLMSEVLKETYNYNSKITTTINDKEQEYVEGESMYRIVPNDKVDQGKAIVSEEVNNFYKNGIAKGKTIKVSAENIYYEQTVDLQISSIYTKKTFANRTGYSDYDAFNGSIFINPDDYDTLFKKGNYQCTIYVNDVKDMDATVDTLKTMSYVPLALKDVLVTYEEDVGALSIVKVPMAVIIVLAVFFIAYFVIRLILRSRAGYFSILRMLGLAKRSIRRILDVELFLVTNIAFGLFLIVVALVNYEIIDIEYIKTLVEYMRITDYVILYLVLIIMAYLISGKFARTLFKKTAMDSYREEA